VRNKIFPTAFGLAGLLALAGLLINPPRHVLGNTAGHVLKFDSVPAGGSVDFPIPVAQTPIWVAVSSSPLNHGTQTPSEVMYAVINQDPKSSQFSWVGTNNDGSVQAGTSIPTGSGPLIASICGGACPGPNAELLVGSDAVIPGTLTIKNNEAPGTMPLNFVVTMVY